MVTKNYLKFRAKVKAQRVGIKTKESLRVNAPKAVKKLDKGMKSVDKFIMGRLSK